MRVKISYIIGPIITIIIFTALVLAFLKYGTKEENDPVKQKKDLVQTVVNRTLDSVIFIKHDTVDTICFAYIWSPRYGGYTSFRVSCDEIPKELLHTRQKVP